MITFGNFLSEAKISAKNLDKAAEVFKRIIEKRRGIKLFRFGGPKGFTEIKGGIGILYISETGNAIRINYKSGEIESIAVKYDSKNDEFDVVMKTIMRKKNFKTPNKTITY